MEEETLGQYIKRIRKQRGLTQEELASEVGITKAYICIIERGELTGRDVSVSPVKLEAIAKSLRVPAEELFNRAGILPQGTLLIRQAGEGNGNGAERRANGRTLAQIQSMQDWDELCAAGYADLPPSAREEVRHFIEFRARQLKESAKR